MDLFEAIYSLRSMRRLKPDPVPEETILRILDAAIHAPNGGNLQPWNFLVLRDPAVKRKMQEFYQDGMAAIATERPPLTPQQEAEREKSPGYHLTHHLAEAPALILGSVRLEDVASTTPPGACIYPALQNLMLAARAEGLGTVLTTLHRHREQEVRRYLGIPDGYETMGLIPLGHPVGRFGPLVRRPVEEVTYWDRWGKTRPRTDDGGDAAGSMEMLEAIYTQRAMRRLKPDPVPEALLWRILEAATQAANGANMQNWRFMVVQDPALKRTIHEYYRDGGANVTRPNGLMASNSNQPSTLKSSPFLSEHLADIPALIIGVVQGETASVTPPEANIFPALQNMMLAARALGLGTVLTTLHRHRETDVKKLLGIPEDAGTWALIPVGWPMGHFGPNKRDPVEEVTSWDRFGVRRRSTHAA